MSTSTILHPIPSRLAALSAVAALAFGPPGCRSAASPSLPAQPSVLEVVMADHSFEHRPAVPPGRVVVHTRNGGDVPHQLVLVRLPEDMPPLDVELRAAKSTPVETVRLLPTFAPGESGSFAVDLAGGRYGFVCFLEDADGQRHSQKGMSSELRVR